MKVLDNVFDIARLGEGVAVIGANTCTTKEGLAIMGRGAAAEAANRFPTIRKVFGDYLTSFEGVNIGHGIMHLDAIKKEPLIVRKPWVWICFFLVKDDWMYHAKEDIIEEQAKLLAKKIKDTTTPYFFTKIGCGNGGLNWGKVEPILDKYFGNMENVYMVNR